MRKISGSVTGERIRFTHNETYRRADAHIGPPNLLAGSENREIRKNTPAHKSRGVNVRKKQ